MSSSSLRVAVVGGGVIGLSVAKCLAERGAQVSLFEKSSIGSGTSATTFAWVNSNGKNPHSYHELNCAGMREHVSLQATSTSSTRWLEPAGTYEWAVDAAQTERLDRRVALLGQRGYPVERVAFAALRERVPELNTDSRVRDVWHFPSECIVHPPLLMAWLRAQALARGVSIVEDAEVIAMDEAGEGMSVALSTGDVWSGDRAVLAAGRWTPGLAAMVGTPLAMIDADRPGKRACSFLATTDPLPIQLGCNLITPQLNLRPDGGGRLLLQAPDLDDHADPAYGADIDGLIGQEFRSRLRRLFGRVPAVRIRTLQVGQRSRPADGLPALGFLTERGRAYVAVAHSGITLGPLLGRLVASELVDGERSALLAPYSPQRLIGRDPSEFPAIGTIHFPAAQ